ncbi:MAG TPA: hypothetical protein VF223_12545 [Trebonia sp.]
MHPAMDALFPDTPRDPDEWPEIVCSVQPGVHIKALLAALPPRGTDTTAL